MDFVTSLPVSLGMSTILVMVDHLSKYIHLRALPADFTTVKVAELFVDIVVKHHGFPRSIVSDRDPVFVGTFWWLLFELSNTKLSMSSSYHSQTDRQIEVVNQDLSNIFGLLFKTILKLGCFYVFG